MTNELQLDFDVDPEIQVERFPEIVREEYPSARIRHAEKVLVANSGPVDYLGWVVLDGYQEHCFFYKDDDPDRETLRWLISITPQESDMPRLKRVLQQLYDEYAESNLGVLIEIPDSYLPGSGPKANIGFYHNPLTDEINSGIITTPIDQHDRILEDVAKLVPARDLETFVLNATRTLRTELREEAERHLIEGDASAVLEQDDHFRLETTREIPDGIHPGYTGTEAELWQKPVSRVQYLLGAQGFVQIWIPISEEKISLVSVTRGEFDPETAVDDVRQTLLKKIQ